MNLGLPTNNQSISTLNSQRNDPIFRQGIHIFDQERIDDTLLRNDEVHAMSILEEEQLVCTLGTSKDDVFDEPRKPSYLDALIEPLSKGSALRHTRPCRKTCARTCTCAA